MKHMTLLRLSTVLVIVLAGCSSMTPGKLSSVQPHSDKPRAGNVYLLRGWIGVFSTGIDTLTVKLNDQGVRAHQYQDDQWRSLANRINKEYKGKSGVEPVVLVGHSYGADDVVRIARKLNEENVTVDLLITLDPVTPPNVPKNVKMCVNLYQPNAVMDVMPFLRGIPLTPDSDFNGTLVNANLRGEYRELLESGTDHFNIEKKNKIHEEIIRRVLITCPPRSQWAAANGKSAVPAPPAKPVQPINAKTEGSKSTDNGSTDKRVSGSFGD